MAISEERVDLANAYDNVLPLSDAFEKVQPFIDVFTAALIAFALMKLYDSIGLAAYSYTYYFAFIITVFYFIDDSLQARILTHFFPYPRSIRLYQDILLTTIFYGVIVILSSCNRNLLINNQNIIDLNCNGLNIKTMDDIYLLYIVAFMLISAITFFWCISLIREITVDVIEKIRILDSNEIDTCKNVLFFICCCHGCFLLIWGIIYILFYEFSYASSMTICETKYLIAFTSKPITNYIHHYFPLIVICVFGLWYFIHDFIREIIFSEAYENNPIAGRILRPGVFGLLVRWHKNIPKDIFVRIKNVLKELWGI